MNSTDWPRLWILNRLVPWQVDLARLVLHPEEKMGAYWDFPYDGEVLTDGDERLRGVWEANASGELTLFERAEQTWPEYQELHCTEVRQFTKLTGLIVAITEKGQQRWEEEFCPDWGRIWKFREIDRDENGLVTIEITCATMEMMNEIEEHFPQYYGMDEEFGMKVVCRQTVFGAHVCFWKVLQQALTITVQVRSLLPRLNAMIQDSALPFDARISKLRALGPSAEPSLRELTRLSTKW